MSQALANVQLPRLQSQFIALSGSMDLTTPPIAKPNSSAIIALNVQPHFGGGFSRIEGYECVDGQTIPSQMKVTHLKLNRLITSPLTGGVIHIDGQVCYPLETENDVLTVASQAMLNLKEGIRIELAGEVFELLSSAYTPPNFGALAHQQWLAKAFKKGIEQVQAVPGEGELRGVLELNGQLIALRDQAVGCGIFLATATGWQIAPTIFRTKLTGITDAGALVAEKKVAYNTRRIELLSVTPNAEGNEAVVTTFEPLSSGVRHISTNQPLSIAGPSERVNLTKGHSWKILYHNFYGGVGTRYAYACNGAQVIEIRPNGLVIPIDLPLPNPKTIAIHHNHLFVAFAGGQIGHSLVGDPLRWSVLLGSEQFGLGDEITDLASAAGGVLLIGCEHKISALYGTGRQDWILKDIAKVGVKANTLQATFMPIAVSNHGIIRVDQTEQFGDFKLSELDSSRYLSFAPLDNPIGFASTNAKRSQVRFYSRNNFHLCIMLKPDGSTASSYFLYPDTVKGVWQSPDHTFIAFSDGKVYRQSEKCHSFAGKPIEWHIKLAFNHCGSPMAIKSWHSAELQATAQGLLPLYYRYDLDYNAEHQAVNLTKMLYATGNGGRWDENNWNDFLWSSTDYSTPTFTLSGYSRNISLSFSGSSDSAPQFEISGLTLNYLTRRTFRV